MGGGAPRTAASFYSANMCNSEISCVCGKVCKGNRGLKSHQRACRTIRGLNRELTNALRSYDYDNEDEITTDILASVSFSPLLIIKSVARVSQHVLLTHDLLVRQV